MGHWEQIGVENQRHRERRARMDPRWLALRDYAELAVVITISIVFWVMLLWPVLRPFF